MNLKFGLSLYLVICSFVCLGQKGVGDFFADGKMRFESGAYSESVELYTLGLKLDKKHIGCYLGRAAARWELGEFEGAREDYTKAIKYDKKNHCHPVHGHR